MVLDVFYMQKKMINISENATVFNLKERFFDSEHSAAMIATSEG